MIAVAPRPCRPFQGWRYLAEDAAPATGTGTGGTGWVNDMNFIFLGIFVAALTGVLGLTLWLRRSDAQVRRRLFEARSPEFVLPPPDDRPRRLRGPAARSVLRGRSPRFRRARSRVRRRSVGRAARP